MDENAPTGSSPDSHLFSPLVASTKRFESAALDVEGNLTTPATVSVSLRAQGTFRGALAATLSLDGTEVASVTSAPLTVGATATVVELAFADFAAQVQPGQKLAVLLEVAPPAPPADATVVVEMLYDSADAPGGLELTLVPPPPPPPTPTPPTVTPTVTVTPPPTVTPTPGGSTGGSADSASAGDEYLLASGIASAGLAILAVLGLSRRG